MSLRTIYLLLAIIGAVVPYLFFLQHFQSEGLALGSFVAALFVNDVAGGFTADLLLSSLVFWIAIIHRHRRDNGPGPALFIVLNLLIGLSCALPAWLYARDKQAAVG